MRVSLLCILLLVGSLLVGSTLVGLTMAQDKTAGGRNDADAAALTIYNQSFAVVRQTLPLDLKSGTNQFEITDVTSFLEPDSVILRDLKSGQELHILEQNYRSDIASQARLLSLYEGKTVDFLMNDDQGQRKLVPGKIIRSGYVPQYQQSYSPYGQAYYQSQQVYVNGRSGEPIVEIDGKVQFGLPGQPVFPALTNATILKPTLSWLLQSDHARNSTAEFSYVTGGMSWHADYNVVAPVSGNQLELVGWVTLDNQTGKSFPNAHIKLMAGDVNKIQSGIDFYRVQNVNAGLARAEAVPPVTERSFDEYHLYTLQRATTLEDREVKQVEFVRAAGVQSQHLYVYDGVQIDQNYRNYPMENIRDMENFGVQSNPKIWTMVEFKNSKENHLGMPLPKGRLRFYRRDTDGQLEFTGENLIDHTPENETIRLYTGNVFDAVGERKRTYYKIDRNARTIDEGFEITLRNHKKEAMEIRVVEHLYRWSNWEIMKNSDPFNKIDSKTIEYRVTVPADGEKVVTYTAHYTW